MEYIVSEAFYIDGLLYIVNEIVVLLVNQDNIREFYRLHCILLYTIRGYLIQ